jgi:hypothetical protein
MLELFANTHPIDQTSCTPLDWDLSLYVLFIIYMNEQNLIPNFRFKQEKIITLKDVLKILNIVMIHLTIFNTFARKIQSSIICCSS